MINALNEYFRIAAVLAGLGAAPLPGAAAPDAPVLVGLGDSIGEGVQAADASWRTQPYSYLSWIAFQAGAAFHPPLITSSQYGVVGETTLRRRLDPAAPVTNFAVSGADVHDLLYRRADALSEAAIDSETDLVLYPRRQTQLEAAASTPAAWLVCWVGSNEVLGAVTAYDALDASQLTPVAEFERDYGILAERLRAIADDHGARVVVANIPDVTRIGFLMDRADLIRLTGSAHGLPAGHRTTLVTLVGVVTGLLDESAFTDPARVLDPAELMLIRERVTALNAVIAEAAARHDIPVVDIHGLLERYAADPPVWHGIPVTARFQRGLFSLDGVHPSNLGHALIADAFIETLNGAYGTDIPAIDPELLDYVFLTEPALDKDGDRRVAGRFGAGLLETAGRVLGLSGDTDDFRAATAAP